MTAEQCPKRSPLPDGASLPAAAPRCAAADTAAPAAATAGTAVALPQGSEGSVIEDWEVWGDPREVERRRAERKRSALPREARIQLIAEELSQAGFAAPTSGMTPGGRRRRGAQLGGRSMHAQCLGKYGRAGAWPQGGGWPLFACLVGRCVLWILCVLNLLNAS
jgi:hypothetical protein